MIKKSQERYRDKQTLVYFECESELRNETKHDLPQYQTAHFEHNVIRQVSSSKGLMVTPNLTHYLC